MVKVTKELTQEKSQKRVDTEDRTYLDQSDLHSSQEQEEWNQQMAQMSPTQIQLLADKIGKKIRSLK
jgi:hypothetical protein